MTRSHLVDTLRRIALAALIALAVSACSTQDGPALDDADDGAVTSGAAAPGGGLTVTDVLARDADGTPIAVRGFLIDDGSGARMCEAVLESYPPQCGGASYDVVGVDVASLDGATVEGTVAWVDDAQLVGTYDGATLTVSDTTT